MSVGKTANNLISRALFAIAAAAVAMALCLLMTGCNHQQGSGDIDLADGTYSVYIAMEGGSGRAQVESPTQLTVDDGKMVATVVWSSSFYDKMTVDGVDYAPVNTEGNSTFEIPVSALDEPLAISAETLAMSQPHVIDYTFVFSLDPDAEVNDVNEENAGQSGDFHNADLGCGWTPESTMELECAEHFAVDCFQDGIRLICISDGSRYLVVPDGVAVPEGIDDDIVVLQEPVDNIYLVASDTMCLFDALDAVDAVSVSGIKKADWSIQSAAKAMDSGAMIYGGRYNAPDYDLLLKHGVKLAIESTMINHTPEVKEKLETLGIDVLVEQSSYESEPLGRTEWVKLYGALLGKEDAAKRIFEQQKSSYQAVESASVDKTVAFFYISTTGNAVVRKPGDYITKMIEAAGGTYVFGDLASEGSEMGSINLEMEQFYATAKDADVIIYNATIDGGVASLDELLDKNALIADFKAVKEGSVWCTDQNMYQQMVDTGTIVSELNGVLTGAVKGKLKYFYRLG